MLTNIFESRNKTFLNLVKLGDYIGRSLRENVEIFSVDETSVTFLTESGSVIRGSYTKNALSLTDIEVEDAKIFEDKKLYSQLVDKKINNLLYNLLENDLSEAKGSFDGILSLWENKCQFTKTKKKLEEKVSRFDESFNIVNTPEFQRLVESKSDIVKMLKENDKYVALPEIRNTIKLSSIISKSFDMPKMTLESLSEAKAYNAPAAISNTLYDHLCKQELIAKELVESKTSFDSVWATNDKVQKLPSFIYESDENIMKLVAEIVSEVPYFAMATKKQLASLVESNLDLLVEDSTVPAKDIKGFVSKIFEFKKPVKNYLLGVLNEKYGVNVNNLTAAPTFDSLSKAHSVIFETLASISPKNSNIRRVLAEFSDLVKTKTGVEAIDVSDFLNEMFVEAGYDKMINETSLMNYLNFDKVADDLGKIGQVLKMIQAGVAGGGGAEGVAQMMAQAMPQGEGEYDSDGGDLAGMGDESEMPGEDEEQNPMAAMDPEQAAGEAQDEFDAETDEEGMEGDMGEEGEEMGGEDEEIEFSEKEDLMDNLKELEELIASLKGDMGIEGEEEGEEEGGDFEEEGEGEEEDMPDIDTGEGEDEVHIDVDSHNDGEEGEEGGEEEDMPKKKKPKPDIE